ncbi:3-carboxy-cis,cis-muconate cycloisomerase [Streptomyces litchfieldiae]|uniref:3-carboxy-cis,cis-muconate cycloisomerase n=1 Tax=Streptomyces litchfieldiae TaxID=3075543 RepID=A0ABU2MI61_9ACTN|nr:3-carboxy-cis,cis-muconate cycloisomerase [Streptomyces sp. DSM 44938]MDT0341268.1 3-carboxy-cis,cis-muconate cycloisomerase [Streptomyces sp. DSM 44938]
MTPPARPTDGSSLLDPGGAGTPAETTTGEAAVLRALLDAEAALTRAQAACGQAPPAAAAAVTEAAADVSRFDARDLALRAVSGGNPVIPLVADLTAIVAERDPAAAEYVHRGATSQDILDTALMLVARRTLDAALADVTRTERALARLAAGHRDSVMPGRTLTQHAAPTTFGLKAAGWRSLVLDARDRLVTVRDGLPAQLGGAAGTLAAFGTYAGGRADAGLDLTSAYAAELGLAEPNLPWHTLRTPVADLAGALTFTAGALGKLAADVLVLSRTEIAELAEDGGGSSSAMPHKANPVRATLIAAAARRAPGLAASLYGSLATEDERPAGAWHAEWEPLRDLLRLTGAAATHTADLVQGLRVDTAAMRAHLGLTGGAVVSEYVAAELASRFGRSHARQLVSAAVRRAREEGRPLVEVLLETPGLEDLPPGDLDPDRRTGVAGALTDRALRRR